ncbi:MAG: putative metalloprotease CJM1_0395 family protein [Vicinamibacterales bacterium]
MQIASLTTTSPRGELQRTDPADSSADPESSRSRAGHEVDRILKTGDDLSTGERERVAELKKVDREVRAHEQAHLTRAGPYVTGGPTFTYVTGPDGRQYAVAGEVKLDMSPEEDPEATLRKAEAIQAAAVAPAEPSGQDRAVAAKAQRMAREAERELTEQRKERDEGGVDPRLRAYGQPPPDDAGRLLSLLL